MKSIYAAALALSLASSTALAESHKSGADATWRTSMAAAGGLSLKESEIATTKATDAHVKEFATFEVSEQNALGTVLKELNTPEPAMTADDKAMLQKLNDAPKGAEFDKAYIEAQIDGHKKLSSINRSFLDKAEATHDAKTSESRHIAMLAQATITQHIANTTELSSMIGK